MNWLFEHHWLIKTTEGWIMNGYLAWAVYTLVGVLSKWFNLTVGNRILAHSDGGGMDAGTEHSYVPDLKREYSVNYDDEFGYYAQNPRVRALQWALLPIFGFFSMFFVANYVLCRLEFFFTNGKVTWYASEDMREGGVSE